MAIVTPKTKQHLVMKNTKTLLTGSPLQFEDLMRQAEKFEKNYNEVPAMILSISANLAELQRTTTAQNSKIKELQKQNPGFADDISKKTG